MVDVAGGAVGLEQSLLLGHVHVWCDGRAGVSCLCTSLLIEEVECVLPVVLHLPESAPPSANTISV